MLFDRGWHREGVDGILLGRERSGTEGKNGGFNHLVSSCQGEMHAVTTVSAAANAKEAIFGAAWR